MQCSVLVVVVETATSPHVLLMFGRVHNPLCLPGKTASDRPKVVRTPHFLIFLVLLTCKCVSSHSGVHFLDI